MSDQIYEPENVDVDAFEHVNSDLDELVQQAKFGKRITSAATSHNQPFGLMLAKARTGYLNAIKEFTGIDLFKDSALRDAMRCQMEMVRYAEMVNWITEAVETGLDAEDEILRRKTENKQYQEIKNFYGSESPA